jgi:hypothetical protein
VVAQERKRRRDLRSAAITLIAYAARRVELVGKDAKRNVPEGRKVGQQSRRRLELYQELLSTFPIHQTGERRLIHIFLITRDRIEMVLDRCNSLDAR